MNTININISWPVENLSHKKLIAIPLIIATIFGGFIGLHWIVSGTPVPMSLEFSGGSYIRIQNIQNTTQTQNAELKTSIEQEFGGSAKVHGFENGVSIETSANLLGTMENLTAEDRIRSLIGNLEIEEDADINIQTMGSIITNLYKKQARNAAIGAIIAMAIILFFALRHYTAIGSILSVIGLDFLGILGGMSILGIPLSLSSMAGILLIFGYAVNTNILLSTNILRRKGGKPRNRASRAMNTGIKMSTTSATAMVVLNLFTTAPQLQQISAVIVLGILVDMVNTWLFNSGVLLRHKAQKGEKYHARI